MPSQQGNASPSRLEALKAKHQNLSRKIESEQSRFSVNDYVLRQMKKEKLRIKEEIEEIREAS